MEPSFRMSEVAAGFRRALIIAAAILAIGWLVGPKWVRLPAADWLQPAQTIVSNKPTYPGESIRLAKAADLKGEPASADVKQVADWVAQSGDAAGMNFLIIDKRDAKLFVFDADAHLRGSAPILLGAAVGDDTVSGIGSKAIPDVLPEERTTPAGRFVGERGQN